MTPMREIGPAAQSPLDREPLAKRFIAWFGCTEGATLRCFWRCLVDLGLILWITRAPVTVTALAYLIIGQTPQAQDLIIPLAESNVLRIAAFFILQFILLAMPTHYSARLLLDDDLRFHILMEKRASGYLRWLERWVPRLLGLATFGAIILSAYRAIINLPILPDDPQFTAAITTHLYELMGWA